jgi:hypothetical protein
MLARAMSKFNSMIPKGARFVQRDEDHIKYLHPRKGWRFINKRRFDGADVLLPA